jgi:hypothetical protein
MQGTSDINKCPEKFKCMDLSTNKDMDNESCKKDL